MVAFKVSDEITVEIPNYIYDSAQGFREIQKIIENHSERKEKKYNSLEDIVVDMAMTLREIESAILEVMLKQHLHNENT